MTLQFHHLLSIFHRPDAHGFILTAGHDGLIIIGKTHRTSIFSFGGFFDYNNNRELKRDPQTSALVASSTTTLNELRWAVKSLKTFITMIGKDAVKFEQHKFRKEK